MTWEAIAVGAMCSVSYLLGRVLGKRGSDARETALRKDRDHWHAQSEKAAATEKSLRERFAIADGAYMACRAELDRVQNVRSEAGRKAAATRKMKAQAIKEWVEDAS